MTLDPGVFKAYDVRGLYPSEIDEAGAHDLGRGFVEVVRAATPDSATPRIAVGHDVRLSSPSIADALTAGAVEAGAHVTELGLTATEMVYFAVADGNFDGGRRSPPATTRRSTPASSWCSPGRCRCRATPGSPRSAR